MEITKSNRPYLAVRAIITNENGEVLILKRANTIEGDGKWCLPGGNIEYGQTAKEAIEREIRQETSLICKKIEFLFFLENLPSKESELHYINFVYQCNVEGNVKLNYESSDYAWIYPDAIPNYNMAFRNDEILRRFCSFND